MRQKSGPGRDFGEIFRNSTQTSPLQTQCHSSTRTVMSVPTYAIKPALRCLRQSQSYSRCVRTFATSSPSLEELALNSTSSTPLLDPNLVTTKKEERLLINTGVLPIGSRRRRAALQGSQNIPFEQLPYQCFQEARKILLVDREEKLKQIEVERKRIARAEALDPAQCGGAASKKGKLVAMRKYLEELKILADINDPVIKKRFEDGAGMSCLHVSCSASPSHTVYQET